MDNFSVTILHTYTEILIMYKIVHNPDYRYKFKKFKFTFYQECMDTLTSRNIKESKCKPVIFLYYTI